MHPTTPLAAALLGGVLLPMTGHPSADDGAAALAALEPPVCNAGGPYLGECVNGVATVQLDGSASFDPTGGPLEYLWVTECAGAVLIGKNSATPTMMYELSGLCGAKCGRVDLFVRNSRGEVSSCGTQVVFGDTQPPVITCPPDVVLQPGDPTDPGSTGTATAFDACNPGVMVTWSDVVSAGPNGETIITRTWSVDDGCGQDSCDQTITIQPPGEPGLDIKPTSCPNPIELGSNGVVPVALCGAGGFDVTEVDTTSLALSRNDGVGGSVAPDPSMFSLSDTATPFAGELCDCHTLGGDGTTDLNMKFDKNTVESVLQLGGVPNGTYLQLDLSGMLMDGTSFTVSDCIRVQYN